MRGFVGIGHSDNIDVAIGDATKGLKTADLLILIAPYNKAETAAAILASRYPDIPMIGTTGASIGKGSTSDTQIMVVALAGVSVACGLIKNIRKNPVSSIQGFEASLAKLEADPDNTICLEFTTGSEEKLLSTLDLVLRDQGISLAGGSSFKVPLGEKHMVIYNGSSYNRSCVYAFIKNNRGRIRVCKENIYEKLDRKPHHATLTDPNTKSLFQIDGEPAYEVYGRETGIDKADIVDAMLTNPIGRGLGDDISILATNSVDSNNVMFNGKALYENDSIYFMKTGDYRCIHEDTLSALTGELNPVSFAFYIDSVNRLKLFAKEDYLEEYLDMNSSLSKCATFITNSEQYRNQQLNQTLVLVAFE